MLLCYHQSKHVRIYTFSFEHIGCKPCTKHLHNLVTPHYAAHWREIGVQLQLPDGILDIIDYDHHRRAEDCCNAMWERWLDVDSQASWSKVIEAVESPAVVSTSFKYNQNSISTASGQLQKFYIQERHRASEDDWPQYQPEHFTSVALIHHREKFTTTREVIAIANIMHKGEVNVSTNATKHQDQSASKYISDCKISTNISEIFSRLTSHDDHSSPRIILIEGAPGIGKTILSKEIAFKWAKNELLWDKVLLFLIFLRDPNVQKIQSLEQFIQYAINPSKKNSVTIEQYLEDTLGEHCIIVLDGYDEMSDESRDNSFISSVINRKVLKLSSLVITSRPTASAALRNIVDRRVEVLGFTKEYRTEYIHQSLGGRNKETTQLLDYLEANPFIDSLCYIPLNMTILICVLKQSLETGVELPKTQTEINNQFILLTITRYLKKKHGYILSHSSLQSLPSPYKQHLKRLSQLAFVFLGKDKIVFSDNDVETDCSQCVGKWQGLGLLKTVKYSNLNNDSCTNSYNFLHFSIQEFLAAYYITLLEDKKQISVLKNIFGMLVTLLQE